MDFTFSEEQRMGAEVARQLLADRCTPAALRKLMASGAARDESLWGTIADTGLTAVLVPERAGGLGLHESDFVLIAEACGYVALSEPLVEHAGVAAPLLAATHANAALCEAAAAGQATLAVGHSINPFVADADTATAILMEHGGEVHLVEPGKALLTRQQSIDPFRRLFHVDWVASTATRIADASSGVALWEDALDRGALFAAAQCLGLAQRAVDLAVAYAKERKQFGKPIGSYQAVKHLLANVQVKIEFARPVVHAAAAEFAARDAMSRARISHAKLVATEAADLGVRAALQVHGAMGYSWEVDVHFFLKRALALTSAWGGSSFHRARVAERLFRHPIGPEHTFAREHRHG
jgi:alkylation response protein AidB-like acyl-CoA dehydrogenase